MSATWASPLIGFNKNAAAGTSLVTLLVSRMFAAALVSRMFAAALVSRMFAAARCLHL
jgi:hypothetical protein